jgi:hypothetical protein
MVTPTSAKVAASRSLDQSMSAGAEGETRNIDDLIVAHRVRELIGARRRAQIHIEHEIEPEGLSHRGLVIHHAVVGVYGKAGDEHRIGHRALRIAAATRSACRVSGTS